MAPSEKMFYKQPTLPTLTLQNEAKAPILEKIGPYKIESLLGKGGTSFLYLGLEEDTKRLCAIKVLLSEYVNHPEMVDQFLWEAKLIKIASHPNIVKLYNYGQWEGGFYLAMEFIRGVSLRQFLTEQSFSLKRSLAVILQVAYALCHLHTHGIVHRDLKPENILIGEDGEVKVIDLGIALLHEEDKEKQRSMPFLGTPSYMSPEQKENPRNASYASDIFALGILLYELVLGKLSYGMINLSLLPAGLQKIAGKALAISPEERYHDIVDFITDLTAYSQSKELEKERPGTDQLLEFLEVFERADHNLSLFEKPSWPSIDMGLTKMQAKEQLGLYVDFFKFANNTFAIVVAHPVAKKLTNSISCAVLRGMIKSLIHPYLINREPAFDLAAFAQTLNTLVTKDHLQEKFYLSILKLIPQKDTLSYLSCGFGPLLHFSPGSHNPHLIHSENSFLGEDPQATFAVSTDNWNDGDLILLHSFPKDPFTPLLQKVTSENILLSCNRLSETVLKEISRHEAYRELLYPKMALALQRVS